MALKNIFGGIFGRLATIFAINPQIKLKKLKKFWVKIQKIGIFANQV
jgi:hypothetical protein